MVKISSLENVCSPSIIKDRIAGNFCMVEMFVYFVLYIEHHTKNKTTKCPCTCNTHACIGSTPGCVHTPRISRLHWFKMHAGTINYAELYMYEYLKYEIFKCVVITKICTNKN